MVDGSKIGKLEIQAKQALIWLYERRMVPYDWAKLLTAVDVKFDELKARFMENEQADRLDVVKDIQSYLKDNPKQYSTAKEVFTRLIGASGTEFAEKSFFGSYKHAVTREWQVLVQIYEKGYLYWAEQARFLQQSTSFDLVSLRKQMTGAVKAKSDSLQKVTQLENSIFDLEKRFQEACESFWLEPSEDSEVLKKNIFGLVKTIPARFTRIVAQLANLSQVTTFYGLVAGDAQDENGNETFDGAVGILRYLIANGDTCVDSYRQAIGQVVDQSHKSDLSIVERNKYLIYDNFEEHIRAKSTDIASAQINDVIEIEWDYIKEVEGGEKSTDAAVSSEANTSNTTAGEDLSASQAWEIIDTTEAEEKKPVTEEAAIVVVEETPKTVVVNLDLLKQHGETKTILYDTELRQLLIDDLEELECFLKQRQAEQTSKDQSFYAVYQDTSFQQKSEKLNKLYEELRVKIDSHECNRQIQKILLLLKELQDEKFIQTMQIRAKPEQTVDRLIIKIKTPLTLRDKQVKTIETLRQKGKELDVEVEDSKKQISQMEAQVRDISVALAKELSDKVKTKC